MNLIEPPTQVEDVEERTLQESKGFGEKSRKLQGPSEATVHELATSDLLENRISSMPLPVKAVQDQETEKAHAKNVIVHSLEETSATISTPNTLIKEPILNSGFKKLYPDLSLELAQEGLPILVLKPQLPKERLYPEMPVEPELLPFTKEQLKIFEPCSWLENVDSYVEEFVSFAHQERHEFYELLLNYWRCRKQLLLAEAELQAKTSDCQSVQGRLWTFKDEQQLAQVE